MYTGQSTFLNVFVKGTHVGRTEDLFFAKKSGWLHQLLEEEPQLEHLDAAI